MPQYTYPSARKEDVVEDYHGTAVADPYRWMENLDAPGLREWLEAQAALTAQYLDTVPEREAIRQRLTELWNYPRHSAPFKRGGRYFYFRNDGLQNQDVLYSAGTLDGAAKVVLDPNTFSTDGTVALVNLEVSKDGALAAYARSTGGSDEQDIYIRDLTTGQDYPETLKWGRFSGIAWTGDGSGFFYNRYPDPGIVAESDRYRHNKVYFHRVNTPQTDDMLVYERPDAPDLAFSPFKSDDGAYLLLHIWHASASKNRLYYRPADSSGDFIRLDDSGEHQVHFVGNSGATFFLHTDRAAPRGKIVAVDTAEPDVWREVVPQHETDVIAFTGMVNNQLVIAYLHDASHRLKIFDLDGTFVRDIDLPGIGSIFGLTGRQEEAEMFILFASFLYPPTVFRYDFSSRQLTVFRDAGLDIQPERYETRQVFVTSKDGTRVPVFLTHRRGLELNGQNPTLLYGYGGFSLSISPNFSANMFSWVESGGVFAQVVLRGGDEYGEEWHQAGMLDRKQNVFDDFHAAAEWLVANGYTRREKLGIYGRSNGGLLVAACMLQRPELYGAVLCVVPVADMLRFHKFTAGRFWTEEYGNAEANAAHFRFLYAYSPLHNVKPGVAYPPIMVMTAEGDDRVVPMHSLKFTATLQACSDGANPILLRYEFKAGHGLGKPMHKVIAEWADMFSFLRKNTQDAQ